MKLRIIGDIHGNCDNYFKLAKVDRSLQIGDFGFQAAWQRRYYSSLNNDNHLVGQGNHDPHGEIEELPFFAGRYGPIFDEKAFWIGGALSIDLSSRLQLFYTNHVKTWWDAEQLDYDEMRHCEERYLALKPDTVISHTCPESICNLWGGTILKDFGFSRCDVTSRFLERLRKLHKPHRWYYGHFHKDRKDLLDGTVFDCIGECKYRDIRL